MLIGRVNRTLAKKVLRAAVRLMWVQHGKFQCKGRWKRVRTKDGSKKMKVGVEEAKKVQKFALSTKQSPFSEADEQSIVAQLPLWVNYTKFEL